ncbi:hypothetical protein MES5069_130068 [Mesorhizobium escarrei]|uniref:Tn3 transposase DDE domain-containing protein n=1 Tax=Mesorhizobium escarrei TaxID=666018 RepID=A0ABN8JE62_9HYPH|nr:hypothetical protein MES5069_130068 [Mesorhizobium escarrei]
MLRTQARLLYQRYRSTRMFQRLGRTGSAFLKTAFRAQRRKLLGDCHIENWLNGTPSLSATLARLIEKRELKPQCEPRKYLHATVRPSEFALFVLAVSRLNARLISTEEQASPWRMTPNRPMTTRMRVLPTSRYGTS